MCSIMGYCGRGADLAAFQKGFDRTISRGPDDSRIVDVGGGILAFHRLAIMGLSLRGCSPLSWTAAMRCATGSCTALRPCGLPWRKRATPSKAAATAKSCCPSTGSMARPCSPCWTRSSPASFTMDRPGSLSPPGTPSASVPCTMATTKRASSSLPASPRTWWAFAARSCLPAGLLLSRRRVPPLPGHRGSGTGLPG